jgi:hypothetical protein
VQRHSNVPKNLITCASLWIHFAAVGIFNFLAKIWKELIQGQFLNGFLFVRLHSAVIHSVSDRQRGCSMMLSLLKYHGFIVEDSSP